MQKNMEVNYVYDPQENHWTRLPGLNTTRYSHCSIYFDHFLYVFGGRSYPGEQGILQSGEKLRLSLAKEHSTLHNKPLFSPMFRNNRVNHSAQWTGISVARYKRCSQFVVGLKHQKQILVMGGYTGDKRRSKVVEVYSTLNDTWQQHPLLLLHGIERGITL